MRTPVAPDADVHRLLDVADYRRVHHVLDDVATASGDPREAVLEGLARWFGWADTTFFAGPALAETFRDRRPLLLVVAERMGGRYLEHFWQYDVFSTPENRVLVSSRAAVSLEQLHLPSTDPVRYYLERFLGAHGIESQALLHLRLASGGDAVLGVLSRAPHAYDGHALAVATVLSRQLGRQLSGRFGDGAAAQPLAGLTAREREIAALVVRGLSNADIADALFISIDTVKKHLTAVFRKTGCRTRVHLLVRLGAAGNSTRVP